MAVDLPRLFPLARELDEIVAAAPDAPAVRLQPFGDAEVEGEREIADDGDRGCGAELAQHDVEELGIRGDAVRRGLEDRVVAEIVDEARGQPGRRGFVALHRIGDQDRIASGAA